MKQLTGDQLALTRGGAVKVKEIEVVSYPFPEWNETLHLHVLGFYDVEIVIFELLEPPCPAPHAPGACK